MQACARALIESSGATSHSFIGAGEERANELWKNATAPIKKKNAELLAINIFHAVEIRRSLGAGLAQELT